MAEAKERVRVLRQVEHGVLSKVENANGVVTLLKELGRDNEPSVAVAATHCLRRIFTQLLDPAKNPQLPRPAPASAVASSSSSSTTAAGLAAGDVAAGSGGKSKRNKKKRARPEDNSTADEDESAREMAVGGDDDGDGDDNAGRIYQAWLEARYVDFLRVLLGWIAEVDDFHRQGPALRTLMQFVEIEPSLCVSAAKFSHQAGVGEGSGAGKGGGGGGLPGEGTLWGGLFAELVRTIVLGPCSMQPKLLKSLGEDYVNVHDDVRYFLLTNITAMSRQALADDDKLRETSLPSSSPSSSQSSPPQLPADSPLRGFQGADAAFTHRGATIGRGGKQDAAAAVRTQPPPGATVSGSSKKSKKKRKKSRQAGHEAGNRSGSGAGTAALVVVEEGGGKKLELEEVGARLARVLMVVRMVEEQSDLTGFLLPVRLSLPSSLTASARRRGGRPGAGGGGDGRGDLEGDASSSSSDSSDGEEEEGGARAVGKGQAGGRNGVAKGKGKGKEKGGAAGVQKRRMLAIERLRYHKKVFGDAWLACLRLPLPPALYRRVLMFLPGNVIPYMPSPVRLADFLTAAYGLGGVQSVLALDALFLLMQSHDLDYPDFYDSLYRLVTPEMMYAKYRARFFRMVDLCLSSSHVPAYVVAAFLKRLARATLQAPPSGALFTLALVRKLIGRHPECLPLISRKAGAPVSRTVDRLLTSSGALSGTTGLKNRPLAPGGGDDAAAGGGAASGPGGEGGGGGCVDEYDPESKDSKGAGAMNTSLWELAALQNHYHPAVATLARGFLREADKKEAEGEAFAGPSKLAGETYQSLFEQEMRRKIGEVPLAFRRPKGLFDDIPEEGGGVFAAVNFSIS